MNIAKLVGYTIFLITAIRILTERNFDNNTKKSLIGIELTVIIMTLIVQYN